MSCSRDAVADREQRIGVLWLKVSKNGRKFMAGSIDVDKLRACDGRVVIFKNDNKKQENHPDYEVLAGRQRESSLFPGTGGSS